MHHPFTATPPERGGSLPRPRFGVRALAGLSLTLAVMLHLQAGPVAPTATPKAPPPAPPIQSRSVGATGLKLQAATSAGLTLYSIGEPTDEEQLYLEDINRARLDPPAEAVRLQTTTNRDILAAYKVFGVDLSLMATQISGLAPAPPLSMNAQLTASARGHTWDMLTNAFQGHDGTDGSTIGTRVTAQGYSWTKLAENVFSYAESVEQGHAGFEVDWGDAASVGGMQVPPGHRLNIHSPSFSEIGIGVVNGTNGAVGPQLVTQDFATPSEPTPFVTGVVYYDLNGNGTYDVGEGLGGAQVSVDGSSFYAVTARSGGYSVPVSASGSYTVTFSVSGLPDAQVPATVSADNVKLDHRLIYLPPTLSGPAQVIVGQSNSYTISVVGGATSYQWRQAALLPVTGIEGAENGLTNVTAITSPGYSVIDPGLKNSGTASFHLAQPSTDPAAHAPPQVQILLLNGVFDPGATGQLSFASRLSWASTQQVARAQASIDEGQTWTDLWNQTGSGGAGDSGFTTHIADLSPFAGHPIELRFIYDYLGGSFFGQTDSQVGFHIDDIAVTGANRLVGDTVSSLAAGTTLTFVPAQAGAYLLSARSVIGDRILPWGPATAITASVLVDVMRITSVQKLSQTSLALDFHVENPSGSSYQVQSATDPAGPWLPKEGAVIQSSSGNSTFTALVPLVMESHRWFRIAIP